MNLKIASNLSLPLDVVTQTIAILAKRRAGKSYTMRRLIEQLFSAGQQVVVADPKGDQWGLRSSASGNGPGLPIVILGGERGDVPLEPQSGEIIAKLIVEERISALLDLSQLRKHEVATFMTAFMETLYRLKAREIYRTPMMLVVDEADAIAPQNPQKGEERMLGAAEDIVRRGGQRGIGCVLVTQRSAVLNKNVLTQAQILVVLRTIAPQDLKAMKAWIDVHGDVDQGKALMESLPSLPTGDAWFWSPGWPTTDGIFKRVHVLPIETFDSGASPAPGAKRVEPKNLADIDLDALKGHMAATIEKAKENDPKKLKAELARLTAEIASKSKAKPEVDPKAVATAEARGREEGKREGYQMGLLAVRPGVDRISNLVGAFHDSVRDFKADVDRLTKSAPAFRPGVRHATPARSTGSAAPVRPARAPSAAPTRPARGSGEPLPVGECTILTACAQNGDGCTREQLTVLTAYKRSSRDTYLQRLAARWFTETRGDRIVATQAGVDALGADFEPLPTGSALLAFHLAKLPEGERKVLEAAVRLYPQAIDREAVDAETAYKRSSRDTYIQRLASRQLVTTTRGAIRASDSLFD